MPNLQKWVNLSFLVCGVIVWVFLREVFDLVFGAFGWVQPNWVIPPPDVAGIVVGLITFVILVRSAKANTFLTEVLAELVKVTWPNRKETVISTGVVSVMLAIATVCVMFFDSLWDWIVGQFIYR